MSDPDLEQASSAINGHLNPGGGQLLAPGPLLFEKKSLVALTSVVFFGTKINICQCNLVSLIEYENASICLKYKQVGAILTNLGVDESVEGDRV